MTMRTGPVGVRWGGPGHPGGEASPGQGSNLKAASSFGGAPDAMLPNGGRMVAPKGPVMGRPVSPARRKA